MKRLHDRITSADKISTVTLRYHQLLFHKASERDGSAKCDAFQTTNHHHRIHGVLFEIASTDKKTLDHYEGLGNGYETKYVNVELPDGSQLEAFTYFATHIDSSLKPFDWYKEHVLVGARENELPIEYIESIKSVECIIDTDTSRRTRELAIYNKVINQY